MTKPIWDSLKLLAPAHNGRGITYSKPLWRRRKEQRAGRCGVRRGPVCCLPFCS
ncbi:hypothetical protein ACIOHR_30325 [Streptomyces anulatus]